MIRSSNPGSSHRLRRSASVMPMQLLGARRNIARALHHATAAAAMLSSARSLRPIARAQLARLRLRGDFRICPTLRAGSRPSLVARLARPDRRDDWLTSPGRGGARVPARPRARLERDARSTAFRRRSISRPRESRERPIPFSSRPKLYPCSTSAVPSSGGDPARSVDAGNWSNGASFWKNTWL